ncbi:MAG: S24/S26 family peptidase [Myxococcales bacterium]|nr:S24/S26 family peptidase [Myxococcales bacterium]
MPLSAAELADLLEARPPGSRLWVRASGRSMVPFLRSGDSLQVLRCGAEQLARGDVAVVRRARSSLVVHLVVQQHPLRTATFRGQLDPEGQPLGRVIRVRRGRLSLPLPPLSRPAVWLLHRATVAAAQGAPRRALLLLRDALSSAATLPLRRALAGELTIRRLGPDDFDQANLYLGDHLPQAGTLENHRTGFGAFGRSGRLLGVALIPTGNPPFVRHLHVSRLAAGMRVSEQLATAACEWARCEGHSELAAEVPERESALIHSLLSIGFQRESGKHRPPETPGPPTPLGASGAPSGPDSGSMDPRRHAAGESIRLVRKTVAPAHAGG